MQPSLPSVCVVIALLCGRSAAAQDPPRLPRVAVDLHGTTAGFPASVELAASRGLNLQELPGRGFGGAVGLHIYPFKAGPVTLGVGGRLSTTQAGRTPAPQSSLRSVNGRFTHFGPQLSLNFGSGAGWSYLSGGISTSKWSIVPDGAVPLPPDEEGLKTLDYGGGARWFAKPHLAFSFDVRFYAVNPGTPVPGLPSGPRTTLLVVGAGISLK